MSCEAIIRGAKLQLCQLLRNVEAINAKLELYATCRTIPRTLLKLALSKFTQLLVRDFS